MTQPTLLTARQRDVLLLMAAGATHAEAGRRLNIAPGSVKNHLSRAFDRLGALSSAHAVALAIASGQITTDRIRPVDRRAARR